MINCEVAGAVSPGIPTTGKLTDCRIGPAPGNDSAIFIGPGAVLYNCTLLANPLFFVDWRGSSTMAGSGLSQPAWFWRCTACFTIWQLFSRWGMSATPVLCWCMWEGARRSRLAVTYAVHYENCRSGDQAEGGVSVVKETDNRSNTERCDAESIA